MISPVDRLAEDEAARARALEENERLTRENLVLQGRSQQMAALQAENVRLRGLLNSTALLRDDVLVAELIGVSPDPVRHQLVLNKGRNDGVFVGQPLIDADGLMGQIADSLGRRSERRREARICAEIQGGHTRRVLRRRG